MAAQGGTPWGRTTSSSRGQGVTRGALLPRRGRAVGAVWEEQFREELCRAVPFPIPGGGVRGWARSDLAAPCAERSGGWAPRRHGCDPPGARAHRCRVTKLR